jgi:hypothetical protein
LLIIVYFSFHTNPPIEEKKTNKIAISFLVKAGNSQSASKVVEKIEAPVEPKSPKKVIPPAEAKKEPKKPKEVKKKQVKKEVKKSNPKEKKNNNKPDKTNKIKEKKEKNKTPPKEVKPKDFDLTQDEYFEEVEDDNPLEEDPDPYFFTENTLESLDLLVREKFNIHSQIKRCYKKILDQEGAKSNAEVYAQIAISKEGFIDFDRVVILDFYRYSDPLEVEFHNSVDIVIKSLKFCNPIRNLPIDKYDAWREIDLKFDVSGQEEI